MILTNNAGLSLSMCVWLAHDTYTDGSKEVDAENLISATSLLKPTRQIVLAPRVPESEMKLDVTDLIPSKIGNALHDSIENAWKNGYPLALRRLGYPPSLVNKIKINPDPGSLKNGEIPVYLEQRAFKEVTVDGIKITISGKFDQVVSGELNDTKSTSVYTYIKGSKDEDQILQGSIYRWLNPDMITSDVFRVQYIFTNWQKSQVKINKDYPPTQVMENKLTLLSLRETESFIRNKIKEIIDNQGLPEPEVVRCNEKELWRSDPVYKYYSDPKKASEGGRSTKNFDNYPEAAMHASKQGKGTVITVPGKVKACGYCAAFPVCTQKNEYEFD